VPNAEKTMNKSKFQIMKTVTKIFLLIIMLTSFTIESFGQNHGIYYVKFDFYHSLRIPNYHVSVDFQRYGDSISVRIISEPMKNQDEKWNKTKIDSTFELEKSEFDKVVEAVQKINCANIADGLDYSGLDGTTCEISYGGISTGISYKVWTPDYDTKKRNLEDYMDACKLILMTVKLDYKEIF
jgi:hypothetical protein